MKITVEYAAQVKQAAGVASEQVDVEPGCTARQLMVRLAEKHGEPLRNLLLNGDGGVNPSILLFVGGAQVGRDQPVELGDRDIVTVLSPISGG